MTGDPSILLLDDSPSDVELLRHNLRAGGLNAALHRLDTAEAFKEALRAETPDLIISDYTLAGYNGKAALATARLLRPQVPFIFYSGTPGEEAAIDALKFGATDYVLKSNPKRLVTAIRRVFADAEQQRKQDVANQKIVALGQLLDLATDAIVVRDLEDRLEFWNQGAERLFGYARTEVLGQKTTDLIGAASLPIFQQAETATLSHGHWEGEIEYSTKRGELLVAMSRWTLVRDDKGEPERILAINSDITEKKRLEKQFLRAQRMETIGALASGIAHDLNNILAPILMACEAVRDVQPTPLEVGLIDVAFKSAVRGSELVKQLLTFVRGTDGKKTLLQTSDVLEQICYMLKKTLPKSIAMDFKIDAQLLPINADATQLHQVLMNLCINARDAMPAGGKLTVTATNLLSSLILIRVEDTGGGIPPEIAEKIFDPFFTTKEPGKGTGLGLSTVLGIVKGHEGNLKVQSTLGIGTVFEITLPAAQSAGKPLEDPPTHLPPGEVSIVVLDRDATIKARFGP
jgi:two-component system cell cycle sensor histidine kinase/response regulator CckA